MPTTTAVQRHNLTTRKVGFWSPVWITECSCGNFLGTPRKQRQTAVSDGEVHIQHEVQVLEKARKAAAKMASSPMPVSQATAYNNYTSSELADAMTNIAAWAETAVRSAHERVAEANKVLEDEDAALSPTEYEYWIKRQGASEAMEETAALVKKMTDLPPPRNEYF